MWKVRNSEHKTIEDIVIANTGMSRAELEESRAFYRVKFLNEIKDLIEKAKECKIPTYVVGDFDLDGIASCAILWLMFKEIGITPKIRIPHRFSEGYGISVNIVEEFPAPGLLITVDNGIVAHDAIKVAKERGFTVVVIDHHLGDGVSIPCADVVVDPNAIPDSADFNGYCGAGLSYKLAVEVLGETHRLIPTMLSLAAMATVADVMPLVSENRFIVKKGLESLAGSGKTVGMAALLEACGLTSVISAKDVGFKLGPTLNAPGRLMDDGAMKSLQLLVYNKDITEARRRANELIAINEERKRLKEDGLKKLEEVMSEQCLYGDAPLCVYAPDLPEGLVGIYAGSLAESYRVPCLVFTDSTEEGMLKGSGRSYGGVHLKELLDESADLLHKYGGHAAAAGVSVSKDNFEKMKERLSEKMPEIVIDDTKFYDLEIKASQIPSVLADLEKYGPFGEGNPEPVFRIVDYTLTPVAGGFYKVMGTPAKHIRLFNRYANAVGFDMYEKYKETKCLYDLTLYGHVAKNYFMGKASPQVELLDFEPAVSQSIKTPLAGRLAAHAKTTKK